MVVLKTNHVTRVISWYRTINVIRGRGISLSRDPQSWHATYDYVTWKSSGHRKVN